MGLLNFEQVTKYYGQRLLLDSVSFAVERGERLALIGPNGSGKTTLIRIAMGQEKADFGFASVARGAKAGFLSQDLNELGDEGALTIREADQLEQKLRALERDMAGQTGEALDALMRAYEKASVRFEAIDGYAVESRMKATLMGLGMRAESLTTPIGLLSSGEKMRVALARILILSPDLMVLDEPTNHLDVPSLMWLEEYLKGFHGGVLIVSHDRYFLDRVATRIVELKNATTVTHHGNYSSFLSQRQIREAFLQSEKRRLDNKLREEAELARNLRASAHIRQAQSREKGIERLRGERRALADAQREGHLGKVDAVALKLSGDGHISAEVAIAEGVTKKFGDRALFENASFLIRGGEHVAFVGPNGCGKTTLIRMLLGEDADFQGVCRIGGWVRTGLLDQNAVFPDESLTMLEEAMARREQTEAQALRGLAKVGFYGDETRKAIAVLSGGERVRLKLALLLQQNPQCLVLDEPTNHLDLPAREAVERAIAGFEGTVIAVSHDRYFLNRCATRIIAFEDGALRSYDGNWDAYQRARAGAGLAAAAGQRRPEPAPPAAPAAPPANRPDRSEAARLEQEIEELERRMAQAVGAMGPDADPALYRDYGELQTRAAALMARWERLLDAQDA